MSPVSDPLRPADFASDVFEVVRAVPKGRVTTYRATHFPKARPMASMLEAEGVQVQDATVVDFKALFWDPMTEL